MNKEVVKRKVGNDSNFETWKNIVDVPEKRASELFSRCDRVPLELQM